MDPLGGGAAVAEVSAEVDKLSERMSAVQTAVYGGTQVAEKEIVYLTEMLMKQLLKLDGIEVDGEGRVQRKMESRRIQSFLDSMDALKTKNSDPLSSKIPEHHNKTAGQSSPTVKVEASTDVPVTKPSSTPSTVEPSGSPQESLKQRVNSLLASLSQSHSTSLSVSPESTQDNAFASAFQDFKTLLAKDFEEVISKDNVHRMQTALQVLCSQHRKLPPGMINPVKDIQYLFPNMVEKWNKSHESLTMHRVSKEKLEEANKILDEYTTECQAWEEEMEALSNDEKDLEARLSAIKHRKEEIANIQQSTSEQINKLISLPDVQFTSLCEIQEAIEIEQETISYTRSSWKQFRATIG